MKTDEVIQKMLRGGTPREFKILDYLTRTQRQETIRRYIKIFGWSVEDCAEFLDNMSQAYNLLVKGKAI